jgi:hypothetical protein
MSTMRTYIELVEEHLGRSEGDDRIAWEERMLARARDTSSPGFDNLPPLETGLSRTVYVSENPDYEAFIIDAQEGDYLVPSPGSRAYKFGEKTGDPEADQWLDLNLDVLTRYCSGEYDAHDLLKGLKPLPSDLGEMAGWHKDLFGCPVAFWIRPEPNPLQHQARVKFNSDYSQRFNDASSFSVIIQPKAQVAAGHSTGAIKQKDLQSLLQWVDTNQFAFMEFYNGRITQRQLEAHLSAHPCM